MDKTKNKKSDILNKVSQEQMHFRKILPKKQPVYVPQHSYMPNAAIVEIVEQFDTFTQLLIQNYLFCDDKETEMEILNLLDKIALRKNQFVFLNDLRKYDVFLVDLKYGNNALHTIRKFLLHKVQALGPKGTGLDFSPLEATEVSQAISFQVSPQVSVLQSPVLETLTLIQQAKDKKLDPERRLLLLKELVPFMRKTTIPRFRDCSRVSQKQNGVHKFNNVDDMLLLKGLCKFGSKSVSLIQKIFLPHKSTEEIKNRFKNLTRFKSHRNLIKNWKIANIAPLTETEQANLEKGKIWFGEKNYSLIARYFLPSRSPSFLSLHEGGDPKLLVKRNKYFEYPEEDMDSLLLDPCFDLYTISDEAVGQNQRFIKFLKQLYSNGFSDPKLINRDSKEFEATYLTIKLSEKQLSFTNAKSKEMNCLVFNKGDATHSRITFKDDTVLLHNQRAMLGPAPARHRVLDKGLKRVKADVFAEQTIQRYQPTHREIERIAKQVHEREEISMRDKEFYKKLYFN